MNERRKLLADVSWSTASLAVTPLLAFPASVVLARCLGPHDLGLYGTAMMVFSIFGLLAAFGLKGTVTKFAAEAGEVGEIAGIFTAAAILAVLTGTAVGLTCFMAAPYMETLVEMPGLAPLLVIVSLAFPFSALLDVEVGLLNSQRRMGELALLKVAQAVLRVALLVGLVGLGAGPEGGIAALALSFAVVSVLALARMSSFITYPIDDLGRRVGKLVRFAKHLASASAVNMVQNQIDTLMIAVFLTPEDVGAYGVAVVSVSFITIVPSAIQTVTYPTTAAYLACGDREGLHQLLDLSMKRSACLLAPAGAFLAFFGGPLIHILFGREYGQSVVPMFILLIGRVIRGGTIVPIGGSLSAAGRPQFLTALSAIAATINVTLNALLIPRFGIAGAATATSVTLLIDTVLSLIFTARILRIPFDGFWYGGLGAALSAVTAVFLLFKDMVNRYILGAALLAILVSVDGALFTDKTDRRMLLSIIKGRLLRRNNGGRQCRE